MPRTEEDGGGLAAFPLDLAAGHGATPADLPTPRSAMPAATWRSSWTLAGHRQIQARRDDIMRDHKRESLSFGEALPRLAPRVHHNGT